MRRTLQVGNKRKGKEQGIRHFLKMWKRTSFRCGGSWKSIGIRLRLRWGSIRKAGPVRMTRSRFADCGESLCAGPCVNCSPLPHHSHSRQSAECALRPGLLPLRQHHQVLTSAAAMQRRGRLRKRCGRGQLRWASPPQLGGHKDRGQVLAGTKGRRASIKLLRLLK